MNRSTTQVGGDSSGANLRPATYGANALNQYTNRTVPGAVDIIGAAQATATAKVNGQTTYRKVEYYQKALACNNTNSAIYQSVTNTAALTPNTNTITGNIFLPQTPETLTYDLDGNLIADGRWSYTWDGENRLTQMISLGTAPTASKCWIVFAYDQMARRTRKTVCDGSSGSYVLISDVRFVYDGWNLLAELNATNNAPIRSYLWGLDLSATMSDAAGIGGFVALRDHAAGIYHFAAYDGNGNVMALVNGGDQSLSAQYEYSPFGETLRRSGPLAKSNPIRFSTKFADDEAGVFCYSKRTYIPSLGRWMNRDSSGEDGGLNLYAFVLNSAIGTYDPTGEAPPKNSTTYVAIIDVIVQLAKFSTGDAFSRSGSPTVQAAELTRQLQRTKDSIVQVVAGSGGGNDPKNRFYKHEGSWGIRAMAYGAVLGTLGSIANVASGAAEQDAISFVADARDYALHQSQGDTGMAELDALDMAIDMLNITSSSYVATVMWGAMPE